MSSVEKNFSVPGVGRVSVRVTDGPHTGLTIGGGDIDVATVVYEWDEGIE